MNSLIPDVIENYLELKNYMESLYDKENGYLFYQDIFPDNESVGEHSDTTYKPNAIYLHSENSKIKRRIMLKDSWEDDYLNFVEQNDFALCSGLSYLGRANKLEKANKCHSLIIELDSVTLNELQFLFRLIETEGMFNVPRPTYTVLSGTGVHLYYVFQERIDLFPNIKLQLKNLKYNLIKRLWIPKKTSLEKKIQYQGINQAYRMIGSINSKYDDKPEVVAFITGDKITLEYLNTYVEKENRVNVNKRYDSIPMEKAKKLYPDWYEKRIVKGESKKELTWDINAKQPDKPYALYFWWLKRASEAVGGHRYHFMFAMTVYAVKDNYPKYMLKEDLQRVFEELKQIEHSNELKVEDWKAAYKAYDEKLRLYPIDEISRMTGIEIKKSKRNGRKRPVHIAYMNGKKKLLKELGEMNPEGRPSKEALVKEWRLNNPEGIKSQCIKELGITRPTVDKWW